MTKIFNFALKIKGGGREGDTCEVLRPCHPPKIWNVHKCVIIILDQAGPNLFKFETKRLWAHCILTLTL